MAAVISDCGEYRYRLERTVDEMFGGPVFAFFGINPSTADASIDDATVRKWRGFVSRWRGSRFIVGNVFAFRATDVKELARTPDPIGRLNNDHIKQIIADASVLIPCWGNTSKVPGELRHNFRWMARMISEAGKPVRAFGYSKAGDPLHPLMLGYDTPLVDWPRPTPQEKDL